MSTPELPFTGERFIPGTPGEIWVEHWHRYHFARRWIAGKRVLDVACGEGYGSALLAQDAAEVTGVDISPQAIDHARAAYASLGNARFECASCTALPLADASVDVAVSFETVEHIAEQQEFLDELARVLKPDGVLVLSCPNKLEYSDKRDFQNEFHVKELYRAELAQLVSARFPEMDWYGQRPTFFSLIAPDGAGTGAASQAHFVEVSEAAPAEAAPQLASPLYFLVVASRSRAALQAVAPALSVLSDRDDWVHRDYSKVMRELQVTVKRGDALNDELQVLEKSIARLGQDLAHYQTALSLQQAAVEAQKAQLDDTQMKLRRELAARDTELAVRAAEIDRRRGWRWWLKLPLLRLGLIK